MIINNNDFIWFIIRPLIIWKIIIFRRTCRLALIEYLDPLPLISVRYLVIQSSSLIFCHTIFWIDIWTCMQLFSSIFCLTTCHSISHLSTIWKQYHAFQHLALQPSRSMLCPTEVEPDHESDSTLISNRFGLWNKL